MTKEQFWESVLKCILQTSDVVMWQRQTEANSTFWDGSEKAEELRGEEAHLIQVYRLAESWHKTGVSPWEDTP